MQSSKTRDMVLCAIFSAIIVVMTLVPYTGYINYGLFIEITTLHVVVILGAVALGWKYGALLGAVWGVTCVARAFTNPAWVLFTNPLIAVLPRIFVGLVAGAVFAVLARRHQDSPAKTGHSVVVGVLSGGLVLATLSLSASVTWPLWIKLLLSVAVAAAVTALFIWLNRRYGSWKAYAAAIAALCASLTNTVLVLTAINLFGGMLQSTQAFFALFSGIFSTIVGVNGVIELLAAVLITPVLAMAVLGQGKKAL